MKTLKNIRRPFFILTTLVLGFVSCEKEIELDVPQAAPQIVVEAFVTNTTGQSHVRLTRSKSIYDNVYTPSDAITDAEVSVQDDAGNTFTFYLASGGNGYYINNLFNGEVGRTYTLNIMVDGEHITGEETLLPIVPIQGIVFQDIPIDENAKQVLCRFQDDGETEDYYLFKVIGEGLIPYKTVRSDLLFNGELTETVMDRYRGESGTTIVMSLWHINEENYKYFSTLDDISFINQGGPMGGGVPGNPINTIEGNAIGFFSAVANDTRAIEIP